MSVEKKLKTTRANSCWAQMQEVQLLGTIVGFLKTPGRPLDDIHAVKTSSKGLHYRGQGVSSSPTAGLTTALAAAILYPNFIRARHQGRLTACKSNLKNIGTGLEIWATGHSGKYPESLDNSLPTTSVRYRPVRKPKAMSRPISIVNSKIPRVGTRWSALMSTTKRWEFRPTIRVTTAESA